MALEPTWQFFLRHPVYTKWILDSSSEEQKWATIVSILHNINSSLHQVITSSTALENFISSLKTFISEQLSTATTYHSYLQLINNKITFSLSDKLTLRKISVRQITFFTSSIYTLFTVKTSFFLAWLLKFLIIWLKVCQR